MTNDTMPPDPFTGDEPPEPPDPATQVENAAAAITMIANNMLKTTKENSDLVIAEIAHTLTQPGAVDYLITIIELMAMRLDAVAMSDADADNKFHTEATVKFFQELHLLAKREQEGHDDGEK